MFILGYLYWTTAVFHFILMKCGNSLVRVTVYFFLIALLFHLIDCSHRGWYWLFVRVNLFLPRFRALSFYWIYKQCNSKGLLAMQTSQCCVSLPRLIDHLSIGILQPLSHLTPKKYQVFSSVSLSPPLSSLFLSKSFSFLLFKLCIKSGYLLPTGCQHASLSLFITYFPLLVDAII